MFKFTKVIITVLLLALFVLPKPAKAAGEPDQTCATNYPSGYISVKDNGSLYQSFKPTFNRLNKIRYKFKYTGTVRTWIRSYNSTTHQWADLTAPANITLNDNGNPAYYFYSFTDLTVVPGSVYYIFVIDNNPTTAGLAAWSYTDVTSCYAQGEGAKSNQLINGDFEFVTYGYNYTATGSTPSTGGSSSGTSGSTGTGSTGGSSSGGSGSVSSDDATATAVAGGSSSDGSSAVGNINDYPVPFGDDEGFFGGSFLGGMGMFLLIPLAGFTLFLIFIVVLIIILKRRKRLPDNQKTDKVDDSTKNRTQT